MNINLMGLVAAGVMAMTSAAHAATYLVDRTVGSATITGFLETDDTIGTLTQSNFIDWSLTITDAGLPGGVQTAASADSSLRINGAGVSATATDVSFTFLSSSTYFYVNGSGGNPLWCMISGNACGSSAAGTESVQYYDSGWITVASAARTGTITLGTISAVPLPAGLPLLLAGLGGFGFLARRRRKAT